MSEIRCGFEVTENRKAVWAVELELFHEMERICNKYKINYYAAGGTLLGAIRHHGFIPWDDDMDFCMSREDYEKFAKVAPNEIKEPYFVQNSETDKNFLFGQIRIRDNRTTAIERRDIMRENDYVNHGIFIDIFPADDVPENRFLYNWKCHRMTFNKVLIDRGYYLNRNLTPSFRHKVIGIVSKAFVGAFSAQRIFSWNKKAAMKYQGKTGLCAVIQQFPELVYGDRMKYRKEWLRDFERVEFEDTTICVPSAYEEILNYQFGNWHKYVMGGSLHEGVAFDVNHSFTEYVGSKDKLEQFVSTHQL